MKAREIDAGVRQYIKRINRQLALPKKIRERLKSDLREHAEGFSGDHPNADRKEIFADLGTPEDYAESFKKLISTEDIKRGAREKWQVRMVIAVIVTFFASILLTVLYLIFFDKIRVDINKYTLSSGLPEEINDSSYIYDGYYENDSGVKSG